MPLSFRAIAAITSIVRSLPIRRVRQGALLLLLVVVAAWGYLNHRAESFVFAWERPVEVLVVPLIDPVTACGPESGAEIIADFLAALPEEGQEGYGSAAVESLPGSLGGVERWLELEFARHSGRRGPAIRTRVLEPARAHAPPPVPPAADALFLARWRGTERFLDYFRDAFRSAASRAPAGADRDGERTAPDITLCVYFYDPARRDTFQAHRPVAARRERLGVVFVPLCAETRGFYAALLAHELCHTLGASDKYAGERSLYPEGFAEPGRRPPYPQERAEIMALGIPVSPGAERRVEGLHECTVGAWTAEEMGWR